MRGRKILRCALCNHIKISSSGAVSWSVRGLPIGHNAAVAVSHGERPMPRIRQVEPDTRDRLVRSGRGHAQLRPYLEAIASLKGNQMLEVEPEERETMRLIRLRVTRASRQLGKELTCGTTREGS